MAGERDHDLGQVGKEAHKGDGEGGVEREEERWWGWMAFHPPEVDAILEIPPQDVKRVQGPWRPLKEVRCKNRNSLPQGGLRLQHGNPKVSITRPETDSSALVNTSCVHKKK